MLKKLLTPYGARVITSERVRRWRDFPDRLKQRTHKLKPRVSLFHQFDDPYSYLALEASALLVSRYEIDFELLLVNDEPAAGHSDSVEARQSWMRYRLHDARRLARVWRMDDFLKVDLPSAEAVHYCTRCLAAAPPSTRAGLALKLTRALWNGDQSTLTALFGEHEQGADEEARRLLLRGHNERTERGHYRAGMWEFNGSWFLGLDRLEFLEDDLQRWNLARSDRSVHGEFYTPTRVPRLKAKILDVFFSLRSPYSYLCLARLSRLYEQYEAKINLRFRPVLPMVDRGVALSPEKLSFIMKDAARVANKQQIAFGYVRDPLGPGLERCLSLFYYAQEQRKEREFLMSVTQGIWGEAVNIHSERGRRKLTERAGLDWNEAKHHQDDMDLQANLKKNQHQLELMGLWGVPVFALTDDSNGLVDVFWGQDRLPMLEYGLAEV
ncbi:MAG: DsbA family protein [Gammaproteobacteria bacterium]